MDKNKTKNTSFRNCILLYGIALISFILPAAFGSCVKKIPEIQVPAYTVTADETDNYPADREAFIDDFWRWTFGDAGLPDDLAIKTIDTLMKGPDFVMELLEIMRDDAYLYKLVDKENALPADYVPVDLVELLDGSYRVSRSGLTLRLIAAESLERMAIAARVDGIILTAASAYRSYNYQDEVYSRYINELGAAEADRISARPGRSQHQLGLVVDFFPIDDSFAGTPAGIWMKNNAAKYGWSLSYPAGYEDLTGYSWESWHYRYTGVELASFIEKYFEGIQQYALQFIHSWLESSWE